MIMQPALNIAITYTLQWNGNVTYKDQNCSSSRKLIRSGLIVGNKLCWDANAVGFSKQRNSYKFSPAFLYFESPVTCVPA